MDRFTSNVFSGARKLPDSLGILSAGLCLLYSLGLIMWGSFTVLFFATLFMEEYEWLHYLAYLASFTMIGCHILNLIQHTSTKHHD